MDSQIQKIGWNDQPYQMSITPIIIISKNTPHIGNPSIQKNLARKSYQAFTYRVIT